MVLAGQKRHLIKSSPGATKTVKGAKSITQATKLFCSFRTEAVSVVANAQPKESAATSTRVQIRPVVKEYFLR
jgi:hypothetical protein